MIPATTIKRVYKYPIPIADWFSVMMHEGAEVLCVQMQGGHPHLWAHVTVGNPQCLYNFRMAGTGHDLGSNVGRYIGTFQLDGGALVFHVFAESGT